MNDLAIEELMRLFEKNRPSWIPEEKPVVDDDDDDSSDGADIVEKLRNATPCVRCQSICSDAAKEIESLRMRQSSDSTAEDSVLSTLNVAIVNTDPCGREDCVSPSVEFLIRLRAEILRLKKVEAKARTLSATARKVWRKEIGPASLLRAAMDFDRTQPS
jgi:hypothetical protein